MKRLCFFLAVLLLMNCLAGCGGSSVPKTDTAAVTETPAPEAETPVQETETPAPETETPAPETETPAPEEETPEPEAEYLEDFSVQTIDGKTFTLSEELEDHELVLINLFATWCDPCRKEFPFMQKAVQQRSEQVSMIALSVDENDDAAKLKRFSEELGLKFPMGNVGDTGLGRFAPFSIPVTVVVDHTGRILTVETGARFSTEEFLDLFDHYTAEDYDPDICTYRIIAFTDGYDPFEGVLFGIGGGADQMTAVTDQNGWAIFTAPARRYPIEIIGAPQGMVPYYDKEYFTDPFSESVVIIFKQGDGIGGNMHFHAGPEPDWLILPDFTVETVDGGEFTLSEALEGRELILIKLFTADLITNPTEFPALQEAWEQWSDRVAVLALDVDPADSMEKLKSLADNLGVSFPIARDEGTGLARLRTERRSATILADSQRRVLIVEDGSRMSADAFCGFFETYTSRYYDPYVCRYSIYALDKNGDYVKGAVFNFCTDEACTLLTTDEYGFVEYEGLPGRYHIQFISAPNGLTVSGESEWITEPFPQMWLITLEEQ